jgi:hypothetical protein
MACSSKSLDLIAMLSAMNNQVSLTESLNLVVELPGQILVYAAVKS